jgi:DNA-binding NarL/FixJ family response regulator
LCSVPKSSRLESEIIIMPNSNKHHEQYTTTVATQVSEPVSTIPEQSSTTDAIDQSDKHNNIETIKNTDTIAVLLVDDHALLREGLHQLFMLEHDIQVVGDAVDGFEVMQKIRQLQPDVVLMDIYMPVVDGIAVTRQVTQEFPQIAVIMLTMHGQQQQMLKAMKNGARGYVLKSSSAREVAQAIRTVHAGGTYIDPSWTSALVGELRRMADPSSTERPQVEMLSEKELEIIRYVATGMNNREIAEALAYSEKTVKNYLSVIYQKLHLRDRTQVAIFALRQGLLLDSEQ